MELVQELSINSDLQLTCEYDYFYWHISNIGITKKINRDRRSIEITPILISSIKSDEIRKYFITKYFSQCLYNDPNLKLYDFDTDKFEFNKENQTFIYNSELMGINHIKSIEIKNYCNNKLLEKHLNKYTKLTEFDINKCIFNKEDKTITIDNITINIIYIESEEIKRYFIMQIPECFLKEYTDLKLSDFEIDKFTTNGATVYINGKQIHGDIKDIKSEEIRSFCENIKKLKDTIKNIDFNPSEYNIIIKSYNIQYFKFEIQNGITFYLNDIKSPKAKKLFFEYLNINDQHIFLIKHFEWDYINFINYKRKSYILKYIFAKIKKVTIQKCDLECIKEYPDLLIELLELCINTNNEDNLKGLLENKETIIKISDYKKLQNHTQNLRLFNLTAILIEYEYLDKINTYDDKIENNNDELENKDNNLKDELWN
jgi:hypothetical protein